MTNPSGQFVVPIGKATLKDEPPLELCPFPKHALDELRSQAGSDTFAAQWQQTPVPPGGSMIQRSWVVATINCQFQHHHSRFFKVVCTTWLLNEGKYYLKHVLRDRFDYPTLKARAIANAREYGANRILIEDTGVGTALVPELLQAGFSAIAVKPQHDKKTRMAIQSAKFESGRVFPRASWLADLETELFSFPASRHDDQVDSISQALAHEISYGWNENNLRNLERFLAGLGGWRLR